MVIVEKTLALALVSRETRGTEPAVDTILQDRKAAFRSRSVSNAAERESGIPANAAVIVEVDWW